MSALENGLSFIGNALKDHHMAQPITALENPVAPKKFQPILEEIFRDPLNPAVDILIDHEHKDMWTSPTAVAIVFENLGKLKPSQLEPILRKQKLVSRINGDALKDQNAMATVITTTARFDEAFDESLASRNPNHQPGTTQCKYYYTREAIQQINGLSKDQSFLDFLDHTVGFATNPAFEELRNPSHASTH
jgi:hypothetical protein